MGEAASYDYVVIGAGHNGLVAATILALNGAEVLVVDARPSPGGEASGASYGGAWYPRIAYALGLMPEDLADLIGVDLREAAHWPEPSWVAIVDGEEWLAWWRDPGKLEDEMRSHGVADGWREFRRVLEGFRVCARREGVLYTIDPPSLGEAAERLDKCLQGLGGAVEEPWLEWAGSLLSRDIAEALTYPVFLWEPGIVSLYFNLNLGIWGIARRGFTVLAHSLERAARRAGAEILYGVRAVVEVDDTGRARGVKVGSTRRFIGARRGVIVATSILCLPRLLEPDVYDKFIDKSDRRILEDLSRADLSITRVNMAFRGEPKPPTRRRPPPILVVESRGLSGEVVYPTLVEPHTGGPHIVSFSGASTLSIEELAHIVAGSPPIWFENVDRSLLDREYCNPTGCPNHIPMTRDFLLDKRPLPGWGPYRTPIQGLYHASASSHPGGQVTGIPGHNAAVRALLDAGVTPHRHLVPGIGRGRAAP